MSNPAYITLCSFAVKSFGWFDIATNGSEIKHIAKFGLGEFTGKFGETDGAIGDLEEVTNIVTVFVTRAGVVAVQRDIRVPGLFKDQLFLVAADNFSGPKVGLLRAACRGRLDCETPLTGVTAQMMRDIQAEWEAACDRSKSKKAVNYAASNPTRRLALIAQFMRKAMENRYLAESPMLEEFIKAPRDKHRHRSRQQQPSVADLFAVEDDEVQSVNGEDGEIPSPFFETRMEREAREQRELEEKELEAHLEMERAAETERQENIRIAADKPTRRGQNPFHSLQVKKE